MVNDSVRENEGFGILRNVAEDLKTPLLRIVSQLQLNKARGIDDTRDAETIANAALRLLDSYIISTKVYAGQQELALEPVSAQAIMHDCSQYLAGLAEIQGYKTDFKIQRGIGLVMANPQALMAAITSLTYSFLYNTEVSSKSAKQTLVFALRKTKQGIDAGLFSNGFHVTPGSLQKLRNLSGTARQLTPDFAHGSSAGIVIADRLFYAMNSELRPARLNRLTGLAVNMVPSKQLSLV